MRRVAILATTVVIGVIIAMAPASATNDRAAARSNSQWLAHQLKPDGTLPNPNGGELPDHGLMIDTLFALHASGDGALAAPIASFLDDGGHATDFFTWDGILPGQGYDAVIVGGAVAKVLVAAQVSGRDPRDFDGYDMVAETHATIMRSGPDKGRVSNYAKKPEFADLISNDANMFGQALGVIGLAAAGENEQLAIATLLTQQCAEGYFRIYFGYIPTTETGDHVTPTGQKVSTCDEGKPFGQSSPDGDATGLALSALLAARAAGAPGLDEPIARTVTWLRATQAASGGWGGGVGTEAPNTNSTGVIVQALAAAGQQVDKGVAFIKAAQATEADAGNALAQHIGAIAYLPEAYEAARADGIVNLDTWVRAGAQASLGLSQVSFYDLAKGKLPPPAPIGTTTTTQPTTSTLNPVPLNTPRRTVVGQPPRTTQVPGTPAARLAAYLASRLVGGDHVEVTQDGEKFVDYDATADVVLALRALGEQPGAVEKASKFLLRPDSVKAYAHGAPYEEGDAGYAEPLAKLLIVAKFQQADTSELRTELAALRADGKFTDTGSYADPDDSVRRHAWAILATTAVEDDAAKAMDLLVARQCDDGTFPTAMTGEGCGDLAATAAALVALNSKRAGSTDKWPDERTKAVVKAAAALTTMTDERGLVLGEDGAPDVALSSAVAAARQLAGLDASGAAQALGELEPTDFATSLAAAPGVAGRSWVSAPGSPLAAAVRLPLALEKTDAPPAVAQTASPRMPLYVGVAGIIVILVLAFAFRRFINNKGEPS